MPRLRAALDLLAELLTACGSGKYYIKDTTSGKSPKPGTFRAAVLHLGADFGYRDTEQVALADVKKNTAEANRPPFVPS